DARSGAGSVVFPGRSIPGAAERSGSFGGSEAAGQRRAAERVVESEVGGAALGRAAAQAFFSEGNRVGRLHAITAGDTLSPEGRGRDWLHASEPAPRLGLRHPDRDGTVWTRAGQGLHSSAVCNPG